MLRFDADDFAAKLPWFYHGLPFGSPSDSDVFSFEVNGLDLPEAEYALTLELHDPEPSLEVSRDGVHFMPVAAEDRLVTLSPVDLSTRRISIFFRGDAPDAPCPVARVYLHAPDTKAADLPQCPAFSKYVRDTGAAESEALARWDELWPMLSDVSFGTSDLAPMRDALLDWCERRQVVDPADPHFGAIYSEEDKFDFRDAAAAAAAFAQAWQRSGDEALRQRAVDARRYVYRGQHGDGERSGGWAHMVSGAWGGDHQTNFTRITGPLPPVDGVDTAIVINLLCSAIEAGLEPDAEDMRRLRMGAEWMSRSELRPGVFAHHEGATHDCQNSNALAAMALSRAHNTLLAAGEDAPKEWLEAALRGFEHYLEGQEAIGVWPYRFAEIGRGQRFGEQNVPDQGMGLYHFLVAAEELGLTGRNDVQEALKRAARWYLCTSRIDPARGAGPGPTVDLQYKRDGGGLLFSSFTWCRFMAAAVLLRISRLTDEREPWRALALRLMEHVRAKLWNEDDPERAPVVSSCRPDITLQSWIAAAEWEAVLLEEMIEGLGHAT